MLSVAAPEDFWAQGALVSMPGRLTAVEYLLKTLKEQSQVQYSMYGSVLFLFAAIPFMAARNNEFRRGTRRRCTCRPRWK